MAVPGRKPKPSYIKVLEGNPGHRPINKNEPHYEAVCPPAPSHLSYAAKQEWKRLAPILASRGLLTDAWLGTFEALCEAYGDWRQASKQVKRLKGAIVFTTPKGFKSIEPIVGYRDRARLAYVKIGGLFGLNPAENGRLGIGGKDGGEVDPMEQALTG